MGFLGCSGKTENNNVSFSIISELEIRSFIYKNVRPNLNENHMAIVHSNRKNYEITRVLVTARLPPPPTYEKGTSSFQPNVKGPLLVPMHFNAFTVCDWLNSHVYATLKLHIQSISLLENKLHTHAHSYVWYACQDPQKQQCIKRIGKYTKYGLSGTYWYTGQ